MQAEDRIRQLHELLADDPDDRDLYFLLGKALLDAGRPAEAADRLADAARLNPDHAAIHRFLGEALRDAGRPAGALAAWRAGIDLAERTGDLQAGKEMRALARKLEKEMP